MKRHVSRRALVATGAGLLAAMPGRRAHAADPLRLGVLTDMSSFGRDSNGPGSVQAVRMAVAEFGGTVLGRPIEVLVADHQEKVDIGSAQARKWFDEESVRAIIDVPNSAIGIGVHNLAREKDRIALLGGTFSSDVTNQLCSPNTAQFGLDTYALGHVPVAAIMAGGARTWFFVTADFAFGSALEADATAAIKQAGGSVVGSVRHPVNTTEFSSYLLQAQASGADVVAFANSAGDTVNSIKQAAEFGMTRGRQKLAALLMFITNVHAIGLDVAQGVYAALWTYWDTDDRSRAWSKTFFQAIGAMPTSPQTGSYSGTLHYLKSVREAGTIETAAVMAAMHRLPIEDAFIHGGRLRADGRVIKDALLGRVKSPSESKGAWDYIELLKTIPGDDVFRPVSESKCRLLRT